MADVVALDTATMFELVKQLDPAARRARRNPVVWRRADMVPQDGPQRQAYESEADIIFYGGAAGGGKTDLLLGLTLTSQQHSIIFRREAVQLVGIEERMTAIRARGRLQQPGRRLAPAR